MLGAVLILVVAGVALRAHFTDDRLRQVAEEQINRHLEGKVEIAAVRWRWPMQVEVGQVTIRSPRGQPVLVVAGVQAQVRLLALLRGTLAVSHVVVDQPKVDVGLPAAGGEPPIAQAFKPVGPQAQVPEPIPLRIDFEDVTIAGAQLEVRQGDARFGVTDLHLDDGFVWLGGDLLGGTVALSCNAQVRVKDMQMPLPGLQARLEDVVFRFATETPQVKTPRVTA